LRRILNGLLAVAALCAAACGGIYGNYYFQEAGSKDADPYLGSIDPSVLDARLTAFRGAVQSGYGHGRAYSFYNFGTLAVSALPKDAAGKNQLLPTLVPNTSYDFAEGSCTPAGTYDPVQDAYWRETQFPVLSGLPLANTATGALPVIPVFKVFGVSGTSGMTCNDLKSADSITANKFGATASDTLARYDMRVPFDPSTGLPSFPNQPLQPADSAWYRGLLVEYFEAGPVPTDASGNLAAMEGVLVSTSTTASTATTAKAVLLPAFPGEAGYSPIVRLHEFTAPAGKALGDYTAVCSSSATAFPAVPACTGNPVEIDVSKVTKVTNLLFIVGSNP